MHLLRAVLAAKPVRTPLTFGIQDNIRLIAIDNTERTKDGEKLPRNTFLTFAQYNNEGKKTGSSEFSYFNLDPQSEHVMTNFVQQICQLNDIAAVYGLENPVDPTVGMAIEELQELLSDKTGCKELMNTMWEQFSAAMSPLIGETSPLTRLKIVCTKKGYVQLPSDTHIIESMESATALSLSAYDLRVHRESLVPQTASADTKGAPPTAGGPANLANL